MKATVTSPSPFTRALVKTNFPRRVSEGLADSEGFEPPCRLLGKTLSRRACITPRVAELLAPRSRSPLRGDFPPALTCRRLSLRSRRPFGTREKRLTQSVSEG